MKPADPIGTADNSSDNDPAKQRRERIAIGIVAVIVLGLTLLEANLATIGSAIGYSGNIAIFALININVISRDMILAAHANPDQFPDLVVRVTGFSAYFRSLSRDYRQIVVDRVLAGG